MSQGDASSPLSAFEIAWESQCWECQRGHSWRDSPEKEGSTLNVGGAMLPGLQSQPEENGESGLTPAFMRLCF